MKTVSIRRDNFAAIQAQAEREYPYECCGFVIGDSTTKKCGRLRTSRTKSTPPIPPLYPRDARTAYLMEPRAQLAVLNEIDRRGLATPQIVYHSHPDHDAYFSRHRSPPGLRLRSQRARLSRYRLRGIVDQTRTPSAAPRRSCGTARRTISSKPS